MSRDAKELIRDRLPIADVVGEVVSLKPAGRGRLKGLCPFHSEKTPSFHVLVDRGFFYCFGCQAKGDVFDFVMRTQAMSFPEALRLLGARAGVEVTPPSEAAGKRRDLLDVNKLANAFFRSQLGPAARDYLTGRGLMPETLDAFEVGYAPDSWDALLRHMLGKGVREEDLVALGLVVENERGRRYDRFRDRIVFPIKDALGRVVGFSGRVLGDGTPKYLNSPESDVFRKSELLYGLDRARARIRETGEVVVVEGYTDVMALHQVGMTNAVAALGATLTAEQADALERLDARTVYLAFDADEAGQRAILAGLDQAVGRRLAVRAVSVPHGKDPAEAVLGGHLEEFRQALRQGVSEVEFRFERVLSRHDPATLEGQAAILDELQDVLRPRSVFDPVADEMRRLVIDKLGMDPRRLDDWLASRERRKVSTAEVRGMRHKRVELDGVRRVEAEVVALVLLEPAYLRERMAEVEAALPEVVADEGSPLAHMVAAGRRLAYDADAVLAEVTARPEGALVLERLLSAMDEGEEPMDLDVRLWHALSRLRELHLEGRKEDSRARLLRRRDEIAAMLAAGEAGEGRSLEDLYAELKEIQGVLAAREAERRSRVRRR
ncbi:MAG TPA: DNA primase [Trueperaceae bacterium]|nr:DNA primase [Trueperaceae bacterium]